MEKFKIQTQIDQEGIREILAVLNQTVNKKRHRIEHGIGWCIFVIIGFQLVLSWFVIGNTWMLAGELLLEVLLLLILLLEDKMLAIIFYKNTMPEMKVPYEVVFSEENYCAKLTSVNVAYEYRAIRHIYESRNSIILILGNKSGQAYKQDFFHGEYESFCRFLEEKTGLEIKKL